MCRIFFRVSIPLEQFFFFSFFLVFPLFFLPFLAVGRTPSFEIRVLFPVIVLLPLLVLFHSRHTPGCLLNELQLLESPPFFYCTFPFPTALARFLLPRIIGR